MILINSAKFKNRGGEEMSLDQREIQGGIDLDKELTPKRK